MAELSGASPGTDGRTQAEARTDADGRPHPPGDYPVVVVGSGPGAIQVAYSLSPALLGVARDLTGGYRAVLGVCVGLQLAAALLVIRDAIERRLGEGRLGRRQQNG